MISNFLKEASSFVWGAPLLISVIGVGLYLLCLSRFRTIKSLKKSFKLLRKEKSTSDAQLSSFQALMASLSGTIGMGNIAGVAVAISQGGAGALFWMWIAAILGMNTKFYECYVAVRFRDKDPFGETQGGAMYVIKNALPKKWMFLGVIFAVLGLIGTLGLFQINQLSQYLFKQAAIPKMGTGITVGIVIFFILLGGVRRIGLISSKLVPAMSVFYFLCGLWVMLTHLPELPSVIISIFSKAFDFSSVTGGLMGSGIAMALQIGFKRASFSNEAGIGTAPMAHSNADASPLEEGLVSMWGPIIDTLVICTITGLIILLSVGEEEIQSLNGINLVAKAFSVNFGILGNLLLGVAVFSFSFSTIIGMANYNEKCFNFCFGKILKSRYFFILFYTATLVIGAVSAGDDIVNLMDATFGLMALPNLFAVIYLSKLVTEDLKTLDEEK